MSIAFRQATHNSGVGVTSISKPTGTLQGDIILVSIQTDDTNGVTITPASGFSQIGTSHQIGTGTGSLTMFLYWKIAGASEPTSYTFTPSPTGMFTVLSSISFSTTASFDTNSIDASAWNGAAATSTNVGPITTSAANEMLVLLEQDYNGTTITASGWTGADTTANSGQSTWYQAAATAGSYGAYTVSGTAPGSIGAWLVAIKEAAGGGGGTTTTPTVGGPRGQGMSAPWRTTQRIPLSIWNMMGGSSPVPLVRDVAIATAEQFYGNGTQGEPFNSHGQWPMSPFRLTQRVALTTLAPGYNPPPELANGGSYNDLTRNNVDEFYGLTAPFVFVPQDTSATGAESLALSATLGLSDTGAGTDTPGITATLPLADTATGTDTPGIEADLPLTDSATGTDTPTITATLPLTDSATGTETVGIEADLSLADSATGTETLSIEVDLSLTDSATATEQVAVTIIAPAAPVQTGVSRGAGMSAPWRTTQRIALSMWNMMGGSSPAAIRDVALAAAEQFYGNGSQGYPFNPHGQWPMAPMRRTQRLSLTTVFPGYNPPANAGGGGNYNDLTRSLVDEFYGLTFPFDFAPADTSATGSDSVTLSATLGLSDTGTGTDATGITVTLPVPDSGTGVETLALTAQIGVSDTGSGTDAPTITANVPVSDTGSGTDTPTLTVTFPLSDSAAGTQTVNVTAQLSISDSATGTDTPSITVQINVTDAATGTDVISKVIAVSVSDSATGTDSVSVNFGGGTVFVNVTDFATGTETISRLALSGLSQTAILSGPGAVTEAWVGPGGGIAAFAGPGESTPVVFVFE